jgi:DNA-binding LacI/PurR family transcriptional regulator
MKVKKVTILDIAEALSLSKSTVSLALTDGYGVSDETRSRVLLKAFEIGYKIKNDKSIGIMPVKKITLVLGYSHLVSELFWSEVISGVEVTAVKNRIQLSILVYKRSDDISVFLDGINRGKPQGIIIIGECDDQMIAQVRKLGIPIVLVDPSSYGGMDVTQVRAANFYGMNKLTHRLLDQGFRRFAFWGSITFSDSFFQRYVGVKSAIDGVKGATLTALTEKSDTPDLIFANFQSFIDCFGAKTYPEVLICANDTLAISAYTLFGRMNKNIPADVSVVGFDNIDPGRSLTPRLTTVAIKKFELGRIALLECMNAILTENYTPRTIEVGVYIVQGESVKGAER